MRKRPTILVRLAAIPIMQSYHFTSSTDGSKGIHFTCNDCGDKRKEVEMTKVTVPETKQGTKKK